MRILLLCEGMNAGGAETHIAGLCRSLCSRGHAVTLVCNVGQLAKDLEPEGIRVHWLPKKKNKILCFFYALYEVKKLLKKEKFDVLHAHTRKTALLLRFLKGRGTRVVTVHAKFRVDPWLRKLSYWGEHTIAVSEDLRAYLSQEYGVPGTRITVIPNGIDCDLFSPAEEARGVDILFASRLDADCSNGAILLCRAVPDLCKKYPNLRVCIAGGGGEFQAVSALAKEVDQIVGRSVITMCGAVTDMPSLFRRADICIGVSRVALEAAASGCRVLLCGNEGYFGILSEQNFSHAALSNFCARGYPLPEAEWLKRDLLALLEDTNGINSLRESVISGYSLQQMAASSEEVYQSSIRHKKDRRVVLGGYFGCENLGDDAILEGLFKGLSEVAPAFDITVLSGSPRKGRRQYGIKCHRRKDPFAVLYSFLRADAFFCGGGSLLQNTTGNLSLLYYLTLLRLSLLCGCKTVLLASGIGPLFGRWAKRFTRKTLLRLDRISLRDHASDITLQRLGLPREKLFLSADAALLLPMPPPLRTEFLKQEADIPMAKSYVAVLLNGGISSTEYASFITALATLCKLHRLFPLFLVFDRRMDLKISMRAAALLGGRAFVPQAPSDALALLKGARLTLSMRLHGLVLSARAGTLAVALPHNENDKKLPAFAEAFGFPVLPLKDMTAAALLRLTGDILANRETYCKKCENALHAAQKNIRQDLANTVKILYNKR